jgi:hypothetical protein
MGNVDQNVIVALLVVALVVVFMINKSSEFMISDSEGTQGYVRFYKDFNYSDLLFRIDGSDPSSNSAKYIKYDLKGDAKSMDINLPLVGPPGRRVEIWSRFPPYNAIGTTQTDFYNIFNIPEYDYRIHPNLKLITTVLPGQRYKSDTISPSKRYLIIVYI